MVHYVFMRGGYYACGGDYAEGDTSTSTPSDITCKACRRKHLRWAEQGRVINGGDTDTLVKLWGQNDARRKPAVTLRSAAIRVAAANPGPMREAILAALVPGGPASPPGKTPTTAFETAIRNLPTGFPAFYQHVVDVGGFDYTT